ncbi:MAG: ribosome maturation factor RimM [Schleiferiaceae bacterium]|nr:ribosome maturation factor RimM [Schleiferiaceae bacterium]
MQKEQCFSLGKITKLHGYKGAVVLHIDSSTPQYFKELESVLLEINQELVPFFVSSRGALNGKKLVLSFEDVGPDEAKRMVNASVYLPNNMLPDPKKEKSFYDKAIEGFTAVNQGENIGQIAEIIEQSAQNLFLIQSDDNRYLIPVVEPFIERIDHKKKFIYFDLPEGLLDL